MEEVDPADVGRTYREKHFWEKSFVVLAGIAMNFGLAFVLMWGVFMSTGQEQEPIPVVADVVADIDGDATPAAQAGLQPGDEFVSVDDVVINEWIDLTSYVGDRPEEEVDLVIRRDGAELSYTVTLTTLRFDDGSGRGFLGVAPVRPILELGAFARAGMAGEWVWDITVETYGFLYDIVTNVPEIMSAVFNGREVSPEIRPISVVGSMADRGSSRPVRLGKHGSVGGADQHRASRHERAAAVPTGWWAFCGSCLRKVVPSRS